MKRLPLLLSFLFFVALCASATYWTLQLWRPPARPVTAPIAGAGNDLSADAAAGLFGGRPAAVSVASNYQLKGVVLAGNGRESVAILSADGKPAQAVGIGMEFQPGVSIKEVHAQYILLSESGVIKRVTLPEAAVSQQAAFVPAAMSSPPPAPMQMAPQMPVQAGTGLAGQMLPAGQGQVQGQSTSQPAPVGVPNFVPPPSNGGNGMPQQRNP